MAEDAPSRGNGGTRDGQHVALVHDQLFGAILRGELPAGQVTSQVTLARDLDIGRTPLREALRLLQREGLVVSEPNRRVRIAALSATDAEELGIITGHPVDVPRAGEIYRPELTAAWAP